MARLQKRKRSRVDSPAHDPALEREVLGSLHPKGPNEDLGQHDHPAKKPRYGLTKSALRMLNRTNKGQDRPKCSASTMSSQPSSTKSRSTKATTASRSRYSSAYDDDFVQLCDDHGIRRPQFCHIQSPLSPANLDDIRMDISMPSVPCCPPPSDAMFQKFQEQTTTVSEATLMRTVVPDLIGDLNIPNEGNILFSNLASLTGKTIVLPKPDLFDGVLSSVVEKKVRQELDTIIIPSKKGGRVPVAPNFFLEAKGPLGTSTILSAQATLDGAHGAHIMHALQNYLVDSPVYDRNAYAFSSTLLNGTLNLYAHHITAASESTSLPEYHMTFLKSFALLEFEGFLTGKEALRRLRLRAQQHRIRFIEIANGRARRVLEEELDWASSPLQFFDCVSESGDDEDASHADSHSRQDTLNTLNTPVPLETPDTAETVVVPRTTGANDQEALASGSVIHPPKISRRAPSNSSPPRPKKPCDAVKGYECA